MRVLYFGTWGYGAAGLEALLNSDGIKIVKVFTEWDFQKKNDYKNKVFHIAKSNGLSLIESSKENLTKEKFEEEILLSKNIDLIVSCSFGRIFSNNIINYPRIGAINVHPSKLPKYRGVKPLENALVNNESSIGVTIHELTKELDAGDVLIQKSREINKTHVFKEIYTVQCDLIKNSLEECLIDAEEHYRKRRPQDLSSGITYAPRLSFNVDDNDTQLDLIKKHHLLNDKKN